MVPTEAGQRLYTQIAGAIEKLESIPHKNSTAETPQTIRIGTPKNFLPINFWVNYHRTIALFTLYNLG
jgi:DNA-binding transcriptional LysR family regulator